MKLKLIMLMGFLVLCGELYGMSANVLRTTFATESTEAQVADLSEKERDLKLSGVVKGISEHPVYKNIEDWAISKENTFFMRKIAKTSIIEKSAGVVERKSAFAHELGFSQPGHVLIQDVGRWNGEVVNVRITASDFVNLASTTSTSAVNVSILDSTFLSVSLNFNTTSTTGSAKINYGFENSKGEPIELGTYFGVNLNYKSEMGFNTDLVEIAALSSWNVSGLPIYNYSENLNRATFGRNSSNSGTGSMGMELAGITNFDVYFSGDQNMRKYTFFKEIPVFIETPNLDAIDQVFKDIMPEDSVKVSFGQMIPYNYTMNLESYEMNTEINIDPYYEYEGIIILDDNEVDRSGWFDVSINDGKLTIKANQLRNVDFYSQYYRFEINYKLKNGSKIPVSEFDDDGFYHLSLTGNTGAGNVDAVSTSLISFDTIYVEEIKVTPENALIMVSEEQQLIEEVLPENATDKSVVWSSSDDNIATVDSNGKVTGIQTGEAVIKVETIDGGYSAESTITVKAPYELHLEVENKNEELADEVNLGEELLYTVTVDSLISPEVDLNYRDFTLSIPIDISLENITELQFNTLDGRQVGTVEYDSVKNVVTANLDESDQIHASENMFLSYKGNVNQTVAFGSTIQGKATARKGNIVEEGLIEAESNIVSSLVVKGDLIFVSAPDGLISEVPLKVSSKEQEYPLISSMGTLSVKDLRGMGSRWSLTAKMLQVLTHSNSSELQNAVYYRKNGEEKSIALNVESQIYENTTFSTNNVIVSDSWADPLTETGPFVRIQGGEALKGSYTGIIQWNLQDVPDSLFGTNSEMSQEPKYSAKGGKNNEDGI